MDTMRSLFSAAVDTGGGGESLLGSIKIVVLPIAKKAFEWIGFFTFVTLLDIFSTWASHHLRENASMMGFPYEFFTKLYCYDKVELYPFGLTNCGNSCYANAVL
ncbi:hypothetical protein K1719_016497 [Acacia pycnantha]|nr:hypothetical protein K1719_016497 [Acacia pycnantha]